MLPNTLQSLIDKISDWPNLGPRSAARLALYLARKPQTELEELAELIKSVKQSTKRCQQCFNLTNQTLCEICRDTKRDATTICVVEDCLDVMPLEKTKRYLGLYHVLGGVINPPDGIGPEKLNIQALINRIKKNAPTIKEVILATNPSVEGDMTTLYLERVLSPLGVVTTRLGRGLSSNSDLKYADSATLADAILGRR
ncbi:MAG: recombination protein RecR [Candidatus Portnoybacteria bacterium CG06_land_8_20_14_3_00_39_12]|uniref:Recombination protein RecR n=2 Tax=Candidatus Portnoyibacteriota TaxID=1817913 RepID=A0A2M8KG63_9BACT|nr:MAG: recombination protein RecR [Parcubacteria group bacterium CG1_02_40_25]PIU75230.1 MAG: recombination protein RecR [Candidatus Portnoybacteria bacterium CG06_land_8_20_14_3_00_39_12]PJE58909.1 MAG: recombination protein RecR [Candidatus Portnoybacteria bacterium CG10_big_fil_rev_8_21_14_0_10_40_22]